MIDIVIHLKLNWTDAAIGLIQISVSTRSNLQSRIHHVNIDRKTLTVKKRISHRASARLVSTVLLTNNSPTAIQMARRIHVRYDRENMRATLKHIDSDGSNGTKGI